MTDPPHQRDGTAPYSKEASEGEQQHGGHALESGKMSEKEQQAPQHEGHNAAAVVTVPSDGNDGRERGNTSQYDGANESSGQSPVHHDENDTDKQKRRQEEEETGQRHEETSTGSGQTDDGSMHDAEDMDGAAAVAAMSISNDVPEERRSKEGKESGGEDNDNADEKNEEDVKMDERQQVAVCDVQDALHLHIQHVPVMDNVPDVCCIVYRNGMTVYGTRSGRLVVFRGTTRVSHFPPSDGTGHGCVTALALSDSCNTLLAGFVGGAIVVAEVTGRIVKEVDASSSFASKAVIDTMQYGFAKREEDHAAAGGGGRLETCLETAACLSKAAANVAVRSVHFLPNSDTSFVALSALGTVCVMTLRKLLVVTRLDVSVLPKACYYDADFGEDGVLALDVLRPSRVTEMAATPTVPSTAGYGRSARGSTGDVGDTNVASEPIRECHQADRWYVLALAGRRSVAVVVIEQEAPFRMASLLRVPLPTWHDDDLIQLTQQTLDEVKSTGHPLIEAAENGTGVLTPVMAFCPGEITIKPGSSVSVADPMLVVGSGVTLRLIKIHGCAVNTTMSGVTPPDIIPLRPFYVHDCLAYVGWMSRSVLLTVMSDLVCSTADVSIHELVEMVDMTRWRPVNRIPCHSRLWERRRDLMGGGGPLRVSPDFSPAITCALDDLAVFVDENGTDHFEVTLRPWQAQVDILVRRKEYVDALKFCASLCDGTMRASTDLPPVGPDRTRVVFDTKVVLLIFEHCDSQFVVKDEDVVQALEERGPQAYIRERNECMQACATFLLKLLASFVANSDQSSNHVDYVFSVVSDPHIMRQSYHNVVSLIEAHEKEKGTEGPRGVAPGEEDRGQRRQEVMLSPLHALTLAAVPLVKRMKYNANVCEMIVTSLVEMGRKEALSTFFRDVDHSCVDVNNFIKTCFIHQICEAFVALESGDSDFVGALRLLMLPTIHPLLLIAQGNIAMVKADVKAVVNRNFRVLSALLVALSRGHNIENVASLTKTRHMSEKRWTASTCRLMSVLVARYIDADMVLDRGVCTAVDESMKTLTDALAQADANDVPTFMRDRLHERRELCQTLVDTLSPLKEKGFLRACLFPLPFLRLLLCVHPMCVGSIIVGICGRLVESCVGDKRPARIVWHQVRTETSAAGRSASDTPELIMTHIIDALWMLVHESRDDVQVVSSFKGSSLWWHLYPMIRKVVALIFLELAKLHDKMVRVDRAYMGREMTSPLRCKTLSHDQVLFVLKEVMNDACLPPFSLLRGVDAVESFFEEGITEYIEALSHCDDVEAMREVTVGQWMRKEYGEERPVYYLEAAHEKAIIGFLDLLDAPEHSSVSAMLLRELRVSSQAAVGRLRVSEWILRKSGAIADLLSLYLRVVIDHRVRDSDVAGRDRRLGAGLAHTDESLAMTHATLRLPGVGVRSRTQSSYRESDARHGEMKISSNCPFVPSTIVNVLDAFIAQVEDTLAYAVTAPRIGARFSPPLTRFAPSAVRSEDRALMIEFENVRSWVLRQMDALIDLDPVRICALLADKLGVPSKQLVLSKALQEKGEILLIVAQALVAGGVCNDGSPDSKDVYDIFIRQLCRRQPDSVEYVLQKARGLYNVGEAIKSCLKFGVVKAVVELHRMNSEWESALNVLLCGIRVQSGNVSEKTRKKCTALTTRIRTLGRAARDQLCPWVQREMERHDAGASRLTEVIEASTDDIVSSFVEDAVGFSRYTMEHIVCSELDDLKNGGGDGGRDGSSSDTESDEKAGVLDNHLSKDDCVKSIDLQLREGVSSTVEYGELVKVLSMCFDIISSCETSEDGADDENDADEDGELPPDHQHAGSSIDRGAPPVTQGATHIDATEEADGASTSTSESMRLSLKMLHILTDFVNECSTKLAERKRPKTNSSGTQLIVDWDYREACDAIVAQEMGLLLCERWSHLVFQFVPFETLFAASMSMMKGTSKRLRRRVTSSLNHLLGAVKFDAVMRGNLSTIASSEVLEFVEAVLRLGTSGVFVVPVMRTELVTRLRDLERLVGVRDGNDDGDDLGEGHNIDMLVAKYRRVRRLVAQVSGSSQYRSIYGYVGLEPGGLKVVSGEPDVLVIDHTFCLE